MRTKSVHDQEDAEYGIARSVEMTPIMITDSEDEAEIFLGDTDALDILISSSESVHDQEDA
eukprot:CAMPEP_0204613724 /NCGR_PEP_ID=MMETSP0717-20131115/1653_1 /ASSEMBLY_ACC=CAM_ASM_000666 /TAXON_ID=230516 /ORGANISM="Chaetoceros curvisetus" /LENGTH=60 /DNA_ID=CAMNT_0051626239 /DNA_START=320 /DNA_END=499 /DNA_ORIENTATION=+